jgi:hypothetical protein
MSDAAAADDARSCGSRDALAWWPGKVCGSESRRAMTMTPLTSSRSCRGWMNFSVYELEEKNPIFD